MLKKAKEAAAKGKPASGSTKDLAQAVLDSSHQIWLAGVGAFVRARQEGGKAFETLVQQGEKLEQRTKLAAAETAGAASASAAPARAKRARGTKRAVATTRTKAKPATKAAKKAPRK